MMRVYVCFVNFSQCECDTTEKRTRHEQANEQKKTEWEREKKIVLDFRRFNMIT